jgi:hypothetical protein
MMDRSYLSDAAVVAASREFVCVRLATYESAAEAKVLTAALQTRSGFLENTVFAILGPDGTTPLVRAGRSPREAVGGPPEEAVKALPLKMAELAKRYAPIGPVGGALPLLADLRRGMNVAACEIQPLVVIVGADVPELLPLAWSRDFIGRFAYAKASADEAGRVIEGKMGKAGVAVVQPDAFGLKGKLLAWSDGKDLAPALAQGLKAFVAEPKDSRKHIDEGIRRGLVWKTEIPITDPQGPPRR